MKKLSGQDCARFTAAQPHTSVRPSPWQGPAASRVELPVVRAQNEAKSTIPQGEAAEDSRGLRGAEREETALPVTGSLQVICAYPA